ncbi:MAG: nucleotide exchange factor GrpE [bacterium]
MTIVNKEMKTMSNSETVKKSNNHGDLKHKINPQTKTRKSTSITKIKNLQKKLKEVENEKNNLKDQLLRKAAEFENYKKRRENEYLQLINNANAEVITDLLPILDDFERSMKAAQDSEDFNGLYQGIELIYKNLTKVLENRGVKPIEAIGQEFDPEKHDALLQVESNDHPAGTVVEEHLKGYVMNDRVLRHSQVLVSK